MSDYIQKINKAIISNEEIESVTQVLRSGMLSRPEGGPAVQEFQKMFTQWLDKKYAYATTSGTSALHAAITALGLSFEDEVIVPALSNIADYSVVLQEGGTPVFADMDPLDFNIDTAEVEKKITDKTKALLVVHMYGQPAKMDELLAITKKYNLVLIEDCAQAAGAVYKGKPVGSFGDISCFSLYQTKHIVCGEGGMLVTNDDSYIETVRSISNNGIKRENLDAYDYDRLGYNYQFTDMQAAVGIHQLRKLDRVNDERIHNVSLYKDLLKDTDITFQLVHPDTKNVYFYLAALLPKHLSKKRDELLRLVSEAGKPIKKLYPLSLPEVEFVKKSGHDTECLVAQKMTKRVFNLYVNPGLDENDIKEIGGEVLKAYEIINSN
jgi:perosamine synthetase